MTKYIVSFGFSWVMEDNTVARTTESRSNPHHFDSLRQAKSHIKKAFENTCYDLELFEYHKVKINL